MIDFFYSVFGEGKDLTTLQMALRAGVIFIIALFLVRISGRRSFGLHTAFDNALIVLIGAVLSRAVVGASPFVPTVVSCLILALLHRLFARLGVGNGFFEKLIKGEKITLYQHKKFHEENMKKNLISKEDIFEEVRLTEQDESLQKINEIILERNGKISFIKN